MINPYLLIKTPSAFGSYWKGKHNLFRGVTKKVEFSKVEVATKE